MDRKTRVYKGTSMQNPELVDVPYLINHLDFSKDTNNSCIVIGGIEHLSDGKELVLKLYERGFDGQVIFVAPGMTIEMFDKTEMERAGWVRKTSI